MSTKTLLWVVSLLGAALAVPESAFAQKGYRIGVLLADDRFAPSLEGFKVKMAELGYREGINLAYEIHNAKGDRDTYGMLAQKLQEDRPDLIVASAVPFVEPLAKATAGTLTPVLFLSVADPLRFAKGYASSGNNFTGISTATIELTEKRVELLGSLVAGLKRIIALHHANGPNYESHLRATREAARRFGLSLSEVTVASPDELVRRAPALLTRKLGQAIMFPPDPIVTATHKVIFPHIVTERLPSVAASIGSVRAGALATYAADYFDLGRQGALLADSILKGAKPSDLPIQQPFRFKLVLNAKTANAIGLNIPREVRIRADEVIE